MELEAEWQATEWQPRQRVIGMSWQRNNTHALTQSHMRTANMIVMFESVKRSYNILYH